MLGINQGLLEMVFLKFGASAHLPELHLTVLRGPGVGYRMCIIKAPDSSLSPSSAHLLSPNSYSTGGSRSGGQQ